MTHCQIWRASGGSDGSAFGGSGRQVMKRIKLICGENLCRHREVSVAGITQVLDEQNQYQGLKHACIGFLKSPCVLEAVVAAYGCI